MGAKTNISWTDSTWNPIRGCSVVSEGCRNCYAMQVAARFNGPGQAYEGLAYRNSSGAHWTGKLRLIEDHLHDPIRWKPPRRIFVNSMSDLFHENLSDGQILRVFEVMLMAPQHTYQILTKRPARMLEWFRRWADLTNESQEPHLVRGPTETRQRHPSLRGQMFAGYLDALGTEPPAGSTWPTFDWAGGMRWWSADAFTRPNIWLGVSAEDQKTFDERVTLLMRTPAAVRWVSLEPFLSEVDPYWVWPGCVSTREEHEKEHAGGFFCNERCLDFGVIGGETGSGYREMPLVPAIKVIEEFQRSETPIFVKQDSGPRPGKQGRIPDRYWVHQFPKAA